MVPGILFVAVGDVRRRGLGYPLIRNADRQDGNSCLRTFSPVMLRQMKACSMNRHDENNVPEELVLKHNIRLHELEAETYLRRHPEQTNFFQQHRLDRIVRIAADMLPGNSVDVLDVGCGTGYLFLKFLRMGFKVTGVDLSAAMLGVLEKNIPEDLKSNAKLVNLNAAEFFNDTMGTFSLISMSAFLHHLFDYEALLKAACSALKEGGVLLIVFEPVKQPVGGTFKLYSHKLLKFLDEKTYKFLMRLHNIEFEKGIYTYSDFQRQFGGIDISSVHQILKSENITTVLEEKYCARRYGFMSFVATKVLQTQDSFDIIGRKQ